MRNWGNRKIQLIINIRFVFGYLRSNFTKNVRRWINLFIDFPVVQLSFGFIVGTIISYIILNNF